MTAAGYGKAAEMGERILQTGGIRGFLCPGEALDGDRVMSVIGRRGRGCGIRRSSAPDPAGRRGFFKKP